MEMAAGIDTASRAGRASQAGPVTMASHRCRNQTGGHHAASAGCLPSNGSAPTMRMKRTACTAIETREKDFARLQRQAGQREAIAEAREEALPLKNGEQRGDGHRKRDEGNQVITNSLAVDVERRAVEELVAFPIDFECGQGRGNQRGDD